MKSWAVIALLFAGPVNVQSDRLDVATVFSWWHREAPECATFIAGLQMGIMLVQEEERRLPIFRFCLPAGLSQKQLTNLVFQGLLEAGEVEHFPASRIIMATLSKKFPCTD